MSQMQALIGETVGKERKYRIDAILGAGAMGVVYQATDEKGRLAAVKVLASDIAQSDRVKQRFEREYKILNQFRHPGIVRNYTYGRYRGMLYIAMEYIHGETLEKKLQDGGSLPWREVVRIGILICDALQYAHERGVVHRDLKPSNLMLTTDGRIKLTDFGIAKDLDATSLTATGRTLGTAAYMAPEQIRGTPAISHKTDLYALGIVLYQMLVGRPAFEGSSPVVLMHCHVNEPPPRPSAKVLDIPRALDDLILNLMAKYPADRPWDATAVGMVLSELGDKADRGVPIPMVWPSPDSAAANPPRAAATVPIPSDGEAAQESTARERSRKKARKSGSLATLASSIFSSKARWTASESGSSWLNRSTLETISLALALVAIGGFIVYWLWPPSASYLYHQAEALMTSKSRSDWLKAREEYLDPLDQRFPRNPYREQIQKWRDQILLKVAEDRAYVLSSQAKTTFNKPTNDIERKFVIHNSLATDASARWDDKAAMQQWLELSQQLGPDDPEERGWHLLALQNANQLENAMQDRRQHVLKQLRLADEALRSNHPNQAITIKSQLVDQYSRYTDLSDIFANPSSPPSSLPPSGTVSPEAPSSDSPATPKGNDSSTTSSPSQPPDPDTMRIAVHP
jgi:serine/threonine-protein kinase